MHYKKSVLKSFAKFSGKHLCQSLFFNKLSGLRPATLLKNKLTQVFSCEFCKILESTCFFIERINWLPYRTHFGEVIVPKWSILFWKVLKFWKFWKALCIIQIPKETRREFNLFETFLFPPGHKDVNRMYIRRSEDVQDVFWASYIRSIYILVSRGESVKFSNL